MGSWAMAVFEQCHGLSDEELAVRLKKLCGVRQKVSGVLVAYLSEFAGRRLYAPAGFSSLFVYCVKELGLSESSAYKLILAARAASRFPGIIALLAEGRLNLSAIRILAPHLSPDNWEKLLTQAEGMNARQLEVLAVTLSPKPDRRDVIRALPQPPADLPLTQGPPPCPPEVHSAPPLPLRPRLPARASSR
ncbi:MAG: hypothetical protein HY928_02885 [Elusimicrobia bacterium]|nr:hypothetical protein [Elusimicrobiota bacterium]